MRALRSNIVINQPSSSESGEEKIVKSRKKDKKKSKTSVNLSTKSDTDSTGTDTSKRRTRKKSIKETIAISSESGEETFKRNLRKSRRKRSTAVISNVLLKNEKDFNNKDEPSDETKSNISPLVEPFSKADHSNKKNFNRKRRKISDDNSLKGSNISQLKMVSDTNKSILQKDTVRRGSSNNNSSTTEWIVIDDSICDEVIKKSDKINCSRGNSYDNSEKCIPTIASICNDDTFTTNDFSLKDESVLFINDSIKDKSIINVSADAITDETEELNSTFVTSTVKIDRKKWVKFDVTSKNESPLLTKTKYSTIKPVKPLKASTPFKNKSFSSSFVTPVKNKTVNNGLKSLNASVEKSSQSKQTKSNTKQDTIPKIGLKRTVLPNFALIHQNAFGKMESINDYVERKKERAKMLMSQEKMKLTKPEININKENNKRCIPTSSRQLFSYTSQTKPLNKSDIKILSDKPNIKFSHLPVKIPTTFKKPMILQTVITHKEKNKEKTSVFARNNIIAVANKNKVQDKFSDRNNRRETLKGVRTNRRFDLLMKMRNMS